MQNFFTDNEDCADEQAVFSLGARQNFRRYIFMFRLAEQDVEFLDHLY